MVLKLSLKSKLYWIAPVVLASCGEGERSADTQQVTFKIERDTSKDTSFQLTGNEPLFIGLNILGDGLSFKPIQIIAGEEYTLDLPSNTSLEVRAKVITVGQTGGENTRYFATQVAQPEKLTQEDNEILLQFPAFKEIKSINVYGAATDGQTTVSGWDVKPVDSFTQVTFTLPGEEPIATTNDNGVFAFRMFVAANTSAEGIKMQFTSPEGDIYFKDFTLPSSVGTGFSAGYINLGGTDAEDAQGSAAEAFLR